MKKIAINIVRYILIFIILFCIYFISLTLVSKIPSSKIKENVCESAEYFLSFNDQKEHIDLKYKTVNLFHFTNILMINEAYSIDSKNPIEAFLTCKKNYIPGVTKIVHTETPKDLQSAAKYYKDGKFNGNAYQHLELYDTVNENDLYESFEYARYWHGYLLYLRPLLLLFNYEQIIVFSKIVFGLLLITTCVLIYKKIGKWPAIALVIACAFSDLFIVTKSINEILCFDLALIFSIAILLSNKEKNIGLKIFMYGSITNFFDYLTNPIVTYGLPILIYLLIYLKDEKRTFKEVFFIFFKTSILWFLGYLLTWVSKWIITDVLLHRNIILNAKNQILYRVDGIAEVDLTLKILFQEILYNYIGKKELIFFVITIWILFMITVKNVRKSKNENKMLILFSSIVTCFVPIVWYIVLMQHSYVHRFFTYRNTFLIFYALQILVLIDSNSIYDRKSNEKTEEK